MSEIQDKRSNAERRACLDRRTNGDRRSGLGRRQVRDGEAGSEWEDVERRQGLVDRRAQFLSDRRAPADRRSADRRMGDRRSADRRMGDRRSTDASRSHDGHLGDRIR